MPKITFIPTLPKRDAELGKIIKMNILSNNLKEINEKLNKKSKKNEYFIHKKIPAITFISEKELPTGYYDFRIDNYVFWKCYLFPHTILENGNILHSSGSYYLEVLDCL